MTGCPESPTVHRRRSRTSRCPPLPHLPPCRRRHHYEHSSGGLALLVFCQAAGDTPLTATVRITTSPRATSSARRYVATCPALVCFCARTNGCASSICVYLPTEAIAGRPEAQEGVLGERLVCWDVRHHGVGSGLALLQAGYQVSPVCFLSSMAMPTYESQHPILGVEGSQGPYGGPRREDRVLDLSSCPLSFWTPSARSNISLPRSLYDASSVLCGC